MPHLLNAPSSAGSSHVDKFTDAGNGGGRGEYNGHLRLNSLRRGDAGSSSSINSRNSHLKSSLGGEISNHDENQNNRSEDDCLQQGNSSSNLRDTSSHGSVTSQASTTNIITPFAEKCPGKDTKSLDDASQLEQIQRKASKEEKDDERLPLQETKVSIKDQSTDHESSQTKFDHDNDETTDAAVAMASLSDVASTAITTATSKATDPTDTNTLATIKMNAVTPLTHGMKRKRDSDQSIMESDDSEYGEKENTQESSHSAYQTPLAPRTAVSANPHDSDVRVHPITVASTTNVATARKYAANQSHDIDTANTLTSVARFHRDGSSWSKTPSLVAGSMASSSWYTPNAGQQSATPHGFYSGAIHPSIYYPEHIAVVGSGMNGSGGNMNSDASGAVNGYTTNPFASGTSVECFVPNSSFYTPHRMPTQIQSFHHAHGSHRISQHGNNVTLEEYNGIPLNHSIQNEEEEGNLKERDQHKPNAEQEKVINGFTSTYSSYPQTPTAHILNGTGTAISSNLPPQHYYGYYYPPPPPLSAIHPSSVANGSKMNEILRQYQTFYNPRMPLPNSSNGVETEEHESDDESDKGLCLHNCDRVFIAKSGFIPDKVFPKDEEADAYDVKIPPFQQLVNYPHSSQRKRWSEEMRCVMCGEKHFTSHGSRLAAQSQVAGSPDSDNMYIIPKQNKGLCTACDNSVWKVRKTGQEIKWCKGCKNFKAWEAFGDKYLATKCVKCREKQKEKYARKTGKLGNDIEETVKKGTPSSSSKKKRLDNDPFFVTGQRKGGHADQGLSFLIAASNRVSQQD